MIGKKRYYGKLIGKKIDKIRLVTQEKLNKTRVDKGLKINDYVFVKDRTEIIGAPRPLKTKINPSPYVVLAVKHSTVLVKRLSDGFISLYSQDDVKKYDKNSKLFADLPKKVGEVLLHDFTDLLENDFTTLMRYDPLETPIGISITSKIAKTTARRWNNVFWILHTGVQGTEINRIMELFTHFQEIFFHFFRLKKSTFKYLKKSDRYEKKN